MNDLGKDDDLLEAAFAAARSDAMRPAPDALLARIASDADAELAWRQARRPARGGLRSLIAGLGGWPGLSGLVAATAVGVWIGVAMPSAIEDLGLPIPSQEDELFSQLLPDYSLAADWEG